MFYISSIKCYCPVLRIIKSLNQADNSRFSTSRFSNQGDNLVSLHCKINIFENLDIWFCRIGKVDTFEFDFSSSLIRFKTSSGNNKGFVINKLNDFSCCSADLHQSCNQICKYCKIDQNLDAVEKI